MEKSIEDRLSEMELLISSHEYRFGEITTDIKNMWKEITWIIKLISENIEPGLRPSTCSLNAHEESNLSKEQSFSLNLSTSYKSSINEEQVITETYPRTTVNESQPISNDVNHATTVPCSSVYGEEIESPHATSPSTKVIKLSLTGSHIPTVEVETSYTNSNRPEKTRVRNEQSDQTSSNKNESKKPREHPRLEEQNNKTHPSFMSLTLLDQADTRREKTPMICDECGKVLKSASSLRCHKQIHSNTRPYECKDCGKAFKLKHHLDFHRLTHEGDKKWVCRFCEKGFIARRDLMRHERTHTGEKPFPCSYPNCTKSFNVKQHLILHIRTHTGERPYRCSICNKTFTQANSLRIHRKIHAKDSNNKPITIPSEEQQLGDKTDNDNIHLN